MEGPGLFSIGSLKERQRGLLGIAGTLALALLVVGACVPILVEPTATPPSGRPEAPSQKSPNLTQTASGGNVTFEVTWLEGPQPESPVPLRFQVLMDTHSVDLDRYDLNQLALLLDDAGTVYRPRSWNAPPGGHHREGILEFKAEGMTIVRRGTAYLELVIRDVAGVPERVLRWNLR